MGTLFLRRQHGLVVGAWASWSKGQWFESSCGHVVSWKESVCFSVNFNAKQCFSLQACYSAILYSKLLWLSIQEDQPFNLLRHQISLASCTKWLNNELLKKKIHLKLICRKRFLYKLHSPLWLCFMKFLSHCGCLFACSLFLCLLLAC